MTATTLPARQASSRSLDLGFVAVFGLAAVKLIIHWLTAANYGLFMDEFYFLAAGQHLAWGYVDMPPLTALTAQVARTLFNDSIVGIHLIPALAGAGLEAVMNFSPHPPAPSAARHGEGEKARKSVFKPLALRERGLG